MNSREYHEAYQSVISLEKLWLLRFFKKKKKIDGALVDLNILIAYMSRGYLFSGDPENI